MTDRFDDELTDPNLPLDPNRRQELHGEPTGDDLVAAVYANPDDDGPRVVYGDYLIERGDPRGEFVQLQLARHASGAAPTVRENELFAEHVETWTAPLYEALDPSSIFFERGFLAGCKANRTMALHEVVGHPMWLTVEELISNDDQLVTNPCLRSLKRIQTSAAILAALSGVSHATRLAHASVRRFAEYGGSVDPSELALWRRVFEVGALQQLRSLTVILTIEPGGAVLAEMLASKLGRQLARLETMLPLGSIAPWESLLRAHPSLRCIAFRPGEAYADLERAMPMVAFERDDRGEIRLTLELDDSMYIGGVIASLHEQPPHYQIEVAPPLGRPAPTIRLDELRYALGPQREILLR